MKRYVSRISTTLSAGGATFSTSSTVEARAFQQLRETELIQSFAGKKQIVVKELLEGYNFLEIAKRHKWKNHEVYGIKRELKMDLAFLKDEAARRNYIEQNRDELDVLMKNLADASRAMTLTQFANIFINDYNPEAETKGWGEVALQDHYDHIWNTYQKSCTKAPREHLKTTSIIEKLIKWVFERKYPLEITYFHLDKDIAIEKIRIMQMMIERNPFLASNFRIEDARNWKDGEVRLHDGTTIKAAGYLQGAVGKHPHIIVLDDVIDQSIIFSDVKNDRAIRKFYSDIYPMTTKMTPEKRVVIVGTSQRDDDLYEKLPSDFHKETMAAFVDDEEKQPLEPALFSAEELHKVKSDISEQFGEKFWLKEYMNIPMSAMGIIIKPEWIQTYATMPDTRGMDIYQGWDLGVGKDPEKGDWTVGITLGVKREEDLLKMWVLDMYRARIEFGERLKAVVAQANKWKPKKIGVEEQVFQYDTVITLKKQTNLPIIGVKAIKNKVESFQVELAPHFENRKIWIPASEAIIRTELLSLPTGEHDDIADGIKIAIKISADETPKPRIRSI